MKLDIDNREAVDMHVSTLGWLGKDNGIVSLDIAGEGNMNRTLRAQLDRGTLILKQSLPYVAKYPDIPAPVDRLDAEAAFYTAVTGHPTITAAMPKLVGYDRPNHLLAVEDLGAAADRTDLYEGTTDPKDPDLASLISWLATLHTRVAADAPENLAMRELNHAHIFEIPLADTAAVPLEAPLDEIHARFSRDDALRTRAASLGQIYLGTRRHRSSPALLHGDFYPGSWVRDRIGRIHVIDFEFAFPGPSEFDFGVLTAHLTFAGLSAEQIATLSKDADHPDGYEPALAGAFAGMEIIRRLLGVAQLPLTASADTRAQWLHQAHEWVLTWHD